MERLRLKQAKHSGWASKQTAFLVIFAIAAAAIVFLVIKHGKDCLRHENDCNPGIDEDCNCEEYAPV